MIPLDPDREALLVAARAAQDRAVAAWARSKELKKPYDREFAMMRPRTLTVSAVWLPLHIVTMILTPDSWRLLASFVSLGIFTAATLLYVHRPINQARKVWKRAFDEWGVATDEWSALLDRLYPR